MVVDTLNSFPVSEIHSLFPGNPSLATVWRWMREGVPGADGKRIRLASYKVAGRRYVTRDAVEKFILASNSGNDAGLNDASEKSATLRYAEVGQI